MDKPLFTAPHICLTALDAEADAKPLAVWTQDSRFISCAEEMEPVRPLSETQAKKILEEILEESDDKRTTFWFGIHTLDKEELLGIIALIWIDWGNGAASMDLMMKDLDEYSQPSTQEALALLQNYVFHEIHMHRLSISLPAYNKGLAKTLASLGFVKEVSRRKAVYRFGTRWDVLHYGILAHEWKDLQ